MHKMDIGEMRASSFPPHWGLRLAILILYFYCQQSIPSLHIIHITGSTHFLCGVFISVECW